MSTLGPRTGCYTAPLARCVGPPPAAPTNVTRLQPAQLAPYLERGLATLPRCLGQLDRRSASKTFGCADVHYWRYRLHDLSNARLQEMAWLLALAYARPLPGGARYYQNRNLRAWALATALYWARMLHRDGSVSEVYPFERSFCATAFSTFAMMEVWRLLDLDAHIDAATQPLRHALIRSAHWLAAHDKPAIANQMAAAVGALRHAHRLEPEEGFDRAAEAKVQRLLMDQQEDGAFPEYGGVDYGYQSITLSLLTHALLDWEHDALAHAVQLGGKFLDAAVDERGLYDYRKTSRQAQYLYPAGLVRLGLPCVERHLRGVERDEVLTPQWMDDRYCIALAIDYVLAYEAGTGGAAP